MEKFSNPKKSLETIIKSLWTPALTFYSTYDVSYLRPIVKDLIAYIQVAPSSKTNNVYTKYATAKQSEMALICEKNISILSDIVEQELI